MTDEQYIQYLEAYKQVETRKRYYINTMGMSARLAEATVNAEISGNEKLLKECFKQFKEHGDKAEVPEMRERSKEEEMEAAFLKGFNKSLW